MVFNDKNQNICKTPGHASFCWEKKVIIKSKYRHNIHRKVKGRLTKEVFTYDRVSTRGYEGKSSKAKERPICGEQNLHILISWAKEFWDTMWINLQPFSKMFYESSVCIEKKPFKSHLPPSFLNRIQCILPLMMKKKKTNFHMLSPGETNKLGGTPFLSSGSTFIIFNTYSHTDTSTKELLWSLPTS